MKFKHLTLALLTLSLAWLPLRANDPGEMTPSTYRGVPVKYGSVDAVSGSLDLKVPLGPRLPGRLPWGFTWTYESHNSTHQTLGGEFRPVVWPRTDPTGRFNYTVLVNGGAISFAHNFFIQDMDAQAVLNQRVGDDLGFADAMVDANLQGNPGAFAPLHTEVHPSTDGTKFLIFSGWPTVAGSPKVFFGKRMTILDGTTTLWTNFKGVTWVKSAYGDLITITEQGLSYKQPPVFVDTVGGTITIQNQNAQTLTLTVTASSLTVTNSMGYPEVDLACKAVDRIRGYAEDYSHSGYLSWDYGLIPNTMTLDGQVTTFSWLPVGPYSPPPNVNYLMFSSMTHPNGLVESVGYAATPIKRYSDYAFNPNTGQWIGFTNTSSWISWAYQYGVINQVVQDWNGRGKKVLITRVGPDWVESANPAGNPISGTDHTTTIRTFDSPGGYGTFRDVRLTHFPLQTTAGVTWGAPGASDSAISSAYLFVTSAIQKVDFASSDGAIYKTVQYSNYDMAPTFSWAMGVGVPNPMYMPPPPIIFWDFPGVPSPGVAVVSQPNLPTQTFALQKSDTGRAATAQNHVIASLSGAPGIPWGSVTGVGVPPVDTTKTASLSLSGWLQPLSLTQVNAINGGYLPYLRQVTGGTADLGTVNTLFDGLDRPKTITSTVEGETTRQELTYTGLNPSPNGSTTYVGDLPFSGKIGKSFTYGPGPQFWKTSEKDLLTGQTTTVTPDDQGREIERVDPNCISTSTRYDTWGRVWMQTTHGADTVKKTYDYDPAGLWMRETVSVAGRSLVTFTTYDGFGRPILVTNPDASYQLTAYNGFGEKVSQSPWFKPGQTNYGVTTWTYDGKGRMIRETDPQGRVLMDATAEPAWHSGYNGVLTLTKDDRGLAHQSVTDFLGQKNRVIDPSGNHATFAFNAQGKLIRTVFGGQVREYAFTPRGWMTSRKEPEEGVTTYGDFTAWGFPILMRKMGRCNCSTSSIAFGTELDEIGRPLNLWRLYFNGYQDQLKAYAYDPRFVTQLSAVQSYQPNGTLTETYQYDDWGRPATKAIQDDAGASFSVSQTLDGLGNVTSLTYPAGGGKQARSLTIGYDAKLRPSDVSLGIRRGHMDYDQVSGAQVSQILTYGNGATSRQVFNKGELTLVEHRSASALMESSALSWTAGGLLLSRGADTFGYDPLGRLEHSVVNGWSDPLNPTPVFTQDFTYDAFGNRTGVTATPENTVRPDEALSWTASYDGMNSIPYYLIGPEGNSLATGARYDDYGRLKEINAIPGDYNSRTSWQYDDEGRIVQENETRFLLDAQGLRFRRVETDGTTKYVVYGFNREPLSTFVMAP